MKALALVFTLLMATSAHAFVRVPGTFAPTQCGEQKYTAEAETDVQIEQICLGSIYGTDKQAVEFHLSDGSVKLFQVHSTANYLMAMLNGNTKSNYYLVGEDGEQATMKVVQTREGHILSITGQLGEVPFFVPEMAPVYTMF